VIRRCVENNLNQLNQEKIENRTTPIKIRHWRDLEIWQLSHQIVLDLYQLLANFPKEEKYSLCDQIKRAAVSVPANIVEGYSRKSTKDFVRFCYISRSSLEEVRYYLILALDLEFIDKDTYLSLEKKLTSISVKLNNFIHSLVS